ncbi:MAG: fibronectin type III domain-containing protein [Campylobacterales bacterium]|nr:fibronectin type III domain-containing protein [Campylobacterales bacterium]
MKTVAFEWSSIKDPRVEGIYVYKETMTPEQTSEFERYAVIDNRFKTHYVDGNVEPNTKYSYKFQTFSKDADGVLGETVTLNTLPVLESVSWIHSITGMPRSAKIIWRPHPNNRVRSYIMERKTLEDEEWSELGRVEGRLNAEYIDQGLQDNFVYFYRLKALTYDDILSTPSQSVKVVTKPLPQPVVNIKTTNSLPRAIRIDWDKSTQKDFERYYVYRSESIDGNYELIAKLYNNTFTDKIEEDGKSYFYRVSVVDIDGLESEHEQNSIHGMTLVKPSAPAIVEASFKGSYIELVWNKADIRARSFIVERAEIKGWFERDTQRYEGITSKNFIDKKILPGTEYMYNVYSVDKDGIVSEPSIMVKIETPESTQVQSAPAPKEQKEIPVAPKVQKAPEVVAPMQNIDLSEI